MKLLAIDLDQTLLHTDKSVSSFTKDVFSHLSEQEEIKVIVATGRSHMRAKDYMNAICADGIISLNGAKTIYQDNTISEYDIAEQNAVKLVRTLLEIPDTFVNLTYPDVILTNNQALVTGDHVHEYSDYHSINTHEIQKISLTTNHPEMIKNIDFSAYSCKLIENSKEPNYFVILNEKVSKLTGLHDLCEHLHISMKDVIAFGDDYNDLDILQHAGTGVVVANAPLQIQQSASEVCLSNDEDGVAHWIKKNLFV